MTSHTNSVMIDSKRETSEKTQLIALLVASTDSKDIPFDETDYLELTNWLLGGEHSNKQRAHFLTPSHKDWNALCLASAFFGARASVVA